MAKELDVSLEELLNRGLEILNREIKNLMVESAGGKLKRPDHLVAYIKLLTDLQKKRIEDLSEMSDEDLKVALEKYVQSKKPSP